MTLFERGEYLDRCRRTKARMERAGVDVLLITSPANMYYVTGYDGWSFYTHQIAVLAMDEEEPYWVGRGLDVEGAHLTCFMNRDNNIPYSDNYVANPDLHPMAFVGEFLKGKGLGNKRLGVEMDAYYFTARCYQSLTAALPDATFVDADLLAPIIHDGHRISAGRAVATGLTAIFETDCRRGWRLLFGARPAAPAAWFRALGR